jgi:hypothetical protein
MQLPSSTDQETVIAGAGSRGGSGRGPSRDPFEVGKQFRYRTKPLGSQFEDATVLVKAADDPANPGFSLEDAEGDASGFELDAERQAGNPGAHDRDHEAPRDSTLGSSRWRRVPWPGAEVISSLPPA